MTILSYAACCVLGYLLGTLNPAALLAKIKKKDLRDCGTKNLGATNVLLNFGKKYGALVMIFDILKAFLAVKLTSLLFPKLGFAGVLAGLFAVVGHVYPFYLGFKGGKGLAAFAGLVLGYDPLLFLLLLVLTVILMLIVNYSFIMPFSAAILFPILALIESGSLAVFAITAAASILIIIKHSGNLIKAKNGTDIKVRQYIKNNLFAKKK